METAIDPLANSIIIFNFDMRYIKSLISIITSVILFSSPAKAQETVEEILAINASPLMSDVILSFTLSSEGYPEQGYSKLLLSLAQEGNASAQARLGIAYLSGDGTDVDYELAYSWSMKAANQGHRLGLANLGYIFDFGLCHEKRPDMAFNFYLLAAQKGDSKSFVNVARCYYEGYGCDKDFVKAAAYFEKSAMTDSLRVSETNAGIIYAQELEQYDKAVFWLTKATEQGSPSAAFVLGQCYDYGLGVKEDSARAQELYRYADSHGHPFANTLIK